MKQNRGAKKGRIMAKKAGQSYMKGPQKHEFEQDKRLAHLDKKIKKLNNEAEVKYNDVNATVAPVTTTGDFVLLNGINQGASQNLRIGARVKATSLQLRMLVTGPAATTVDNETVRIIVFWDNDAKGANPTLVGVPSTPPPALLNSLNGLGVELLNPYQLEQRERFKILFDKTYQLTTQVAVIVDASTPATETVMEILPTTKVVNKYIKLNRSVQYGDTDNTIASINNNSLFIAYWSLTGTATVQCTSRFSFKDF